MDMMFNWFIRFSNLIGASVCHQLAERSFRAGELKVPVCARCEGIYIGFFICAIFLFFLFKKKEADLPPLYILIILSLFILSTILEWGFSFFSVMDSTNVSRFITGFLAGSGSMAIIYPVFNYQYYSAAISERIFSRFWQFAIFIAFNAAFIGAGLADLTFLNWAYFYTSIISVLFTFYFINLVVVLLVPFFARKARRFFSRQLIVPSLIALVLCAIEFYVSYLVHQYVALVRF